MLEDVEEEVDNGDVRQSLFTFLFASYSSTDSSDCAKLRLVVVDFRVDEDEFDERRSLGAVVNSPESLERVGDFTVNWKLLLDKDGVVIELEAEFLRNWLLTL